MMLNTEGIIRCAEIVITQLPYRDEFILSDEIRKISKSSQEFKELDYDFDEWIGTQYTQEIDLIIGQLTNGKIVKQTRSIFNEISGNSNEYYVLTKTGRKMKGPNGLRTFEKLNKWKEDKKIYKSEKRRLELLLLKNQAELNPLIKTANISTAEANRISKTTNTYIAIFTGVAGMYYLKEMLDYAIPTSKNYNKTETVKVLTFFITVSLVIVYTALKISLRRYRQQHLQLEENHLET